MAEKKTHPVHDFKKYYDGGGEAYAELSFHFVPMTFVED